VGLEELSRAELIEFVRVQQARIVQLEQRVAEQDRREAEQDRRIEELTGELEKLKRLVSRNSGNSSMPPSKDDDPGRMTPVKRLARGTGRRPGKQGGSKGTALAWAGDPVVADRMPAGVCVCGADLADAADAGVAHAVQIIDIPQVSASTTEHRMHRVRCGCGRMHIAEDPQGAGRAGTRVYGPNLKAFTVYLLVRHALPVQRAAELIGDVTGTAPSTGWVHSLLPRTAAVLADVTATIKTLITLSYVVHLDETPIRCGPAGTKQAIWVAATGHFTAYHLGGRGCADLRDFGITTGLGACGGAVAIHDRYRVYTTDHTRGEGKRLFGPGVRHQVCCAHLLRDFTDAHKSLPGAHWPEQARRSLRGLIHAANTARGKGSAAVPATVADPLISEFRHAVRVGLAQIPRKEDAAEQPKFRALLEYLRDHEDTVLLFVSDTRVPPTNNRAETDLRPTKTQQKISGRLRDPVTTRHRLDIAGYISTLRKHGVDILNALRSAIIGMPWMPSTPLHA
jgi:transposase